MSKIIINDFIHGEERELYQLIKKVFDEFVAKDCTEQGNNFFYDYIEPEKIKNRFLEEQEWIILARQDQKIIGVLDIKNKTHISLLFVDKNFQGQGISSLLMKEYLKRITSLGINEISVHASLYAVEIYKMLGFIPLGKTIEENGIKYVPMIRTLYKKCD